MVLKGLIMVNSMDATTSQAQAPQRRVPGVIANTLFLGGAGALAGSTFWAPSAIKTPEALLGLDKDKFESTIKRVKEKAPEEAQNAKKTLIDQKKAITAAQEIVDKELTAVFPEGVEELTTDELISKKYSLPSMHHADVKMKYDEQVAKGKQSFVDYLSANEGKVLDRAGFQQSLVGHLGYDEANAEKILNNIYPAPKKKGRLGRLIAKIKGNSTPKPEVVSTDKVLQKLENNKKMTKELFLQKEDTKELKAFYDYFSKSDFKEGKVSKEAFSGYLAGINKPAINEETSQTAYNSIKKYLPKKRLQGALKFGGIAVVSSLLVSFIANKLSHKGEK
jgi:hypothetical protein